MTSLVDEVKRQVKVIDADTHLTERHDLWTSRAPAGMKDAVPHVAIVDGEPTWVAGDGGLLGRAGGGGVIDPEEHKGRSSEALFQWTIEQIHPGAYDPVARLETMDRAGVYAQVIFPNAVGLGGQNLSEAMPDEALRLLCLEIYNDANAEMQEASGNRLLPMAVMPAWNIDACVREAERAKSLGMRGVNMTHDPQDQGSPDLADRAWDPFWEACASLELPVHYHIGASQTAMTFFENYAWAGQQEDIALGIGGTLLFVGNSRVVVNMICSGILERHPDLKVVSVESGAGWVPFVLEALDYEMWENAPQEREKWSMTPKEYFQRQMYATMWFERTNVPALVDWLGADHILFETDFPHPTCLYPDPLDTVLDNWRDLDPDARNKILGGNAAKLYKL